MTVSVARDGAARGPYKNGLKRRREIVEAASLVFGQYGYHGGSLRTIAERVGTTPATLVAYFTNKEGLLVAVLEAWRDATTNGSTEHGLDHFRTYIPLMGYHTEHRGLIELFLTMSTEATQPDHPARPFIIERQQMTIQGMSENMVAAIEAGQFRPMSPTVIEWEARLLVAVLDGIELEWLLDPGIDLVGIVRHHMDSTIARWTGRPLDEIAAETDAWLASRGPND